MNRKIALTNIPPESRIAEARVKTVFKQVLSPFYPQTANPKGVLFPQPYPQPTHVKVIDIIMSIFSTSTVHSYNLQKQHQPTSCLRYLRQRHDDKR